MREGTSGGARKDFFSVFVWSSPDFREKFFFWSLPDFWEKFSSLARKDLFFFLFVCFGFYLIWVQNSQSITYVLFIFFFNKNCARGAKLIFPSRRGVSFKMN